MLNIRNITIVLGFFEFIAAAQFYLAPTKDLLAANPVLPAVFITDPMVRVLFCAYVLTLGLARLTFGFGNMTLVPWIWLVFTHVVECAFWWILALQSSFNTRNLTVLELATEAASLKLPGGGQTMIQLIGVPVLIVIYIILGPRKEKNPAKKD